MKKIIFLILSAFALGIGPDAGAMDVCEFNDALHEVDSLYKEHSGCNKAVLRLSKVTVRGKFLDFYFDGSISDFPLRPSDNEWLRECLKTKLPSEYSDFTIGDLYCCNASISKLAVPAPGNDGSARTSRLKVSRKRTDAPLVRRGEKYTRGLSGRHIVLWQSHGLYFNIADNRWMWQRPNMFETVEDLFTQSFVVPFLSPMLENAGANVLMPRERDWRDEEIIIDNDKSENESGRIHGHFSKKGKWLDGGAGFADVCPQYKNTENPFVMGSALKVDCTTAKNRAASAEWSAEIPQRGEYALYVSYPSYKNSCTSAPYVIHAFGHDVKVKVNQRMGGGTWVYLGTYEFDKGEQKILTLSNISKSQGYVGADAVKLGGGMGNIARSCNDSTVPVTSSMPRFAEGARYFLQWSGFPTKVWSQNEFKDDYRDDLMSRGAYTGYLCGGSVANPENDGLRIPVDLSLAFHTDAGTKTDDSIVGTLSIYTLKCDGRKTFPNKESRETCRELADFVQTQVTDDLRSQWDSLWCRRMLWNRSYSESRTTSVPAVLLELLSHANFEDMKYGLDPSFRFAVSRSCYKAILKYLSMHYGCPYTVQPLPVKNFSAGLSFDDAGTARVTLRWEASDDPLEKTAVPDGYIVYTRVDGGGWDSGVRVTGNKYLTQAGKGHIYSYKVVAENAGGTSFPSEILSVGVVSPDAHKVLIVNNFDRISGPLWFDGAELAGFDSRNDCGVPYIRDWNYTGDQFEFRRNRPYKDNVDVGFGASYDDFKDVVTAGNSFDYPFIHGKSIMNAGCNFCSCSSAAFSGEGRLADGCLAIDIICGKQCAVRTGNRSPIRCEIFPEGLQDAMKSSASRGCNILISGSYIGSDVFDSVYSTDDLAQADSTYAARKKATREFVKEVLGYQLQRSHGSRTGELSIIGSVTKTSFPVKPNPESYCAESPDALCPLCLGGEVTMVYNDTSLGAAVRSGHSGYKVVALGFPIEIVTDEKARDEIISQALRYFTK